MRRAAEREAQRQQTVEKVLGIALADRFKLDSALFCTALTLGTVAYIFLAPALSTYLTLFT